MKMLQAAPSRHRCLRLCSSTVWQQRDLTVGSIHQQSGGHSFDRDCYPQCKTVGNTEEITQVQSFDKVDMAFAVRDQSRQRRTLLMLRVFCFLIE